MDTDSADITVSPQTVTAAPKELDGGKQFSLKSKSIVKLVLGGFSKVLGEVTAVVLGAGIIWLGLLTSVMAKGEADVSFLKRNFSLWFAQAYDGQDADIEKFKVQWHPSRATIGLLAKNITVTDDAGGTLLSVKSVYTETPIAALINKGVEINRLTLEGGQFTIKRGENGAIIGSIGEPQSFGRIGAVIPISSGPSDDKGQNTIDFMSLSGTDVFFQDDILGLEVDLKAVDFNTRITDSEIIAIGDAEIGFNDPSDLNLDDGTAPQVRVKVMRSLKAKKALDVNIEVNALNPAKLQFKDNYFHQLKQMDVPLNLMFNWRDVKDELRDVKFNIAMTSNDILPSLYGVKDIQDMALSGVFDVIGDKVSFENYAVSSPDFQIQGHGDISGVIAYQAGGSEALNFDLNFEDFGWSGFSLLPRPIRIKKGQVQGQYSPQAAQLDLSKLHLPIENYVLAGEGRLNNLFGHQSYGPRSLKLKGGFIGSLSEIDLLALWPKNAILGGRNWVKSSVVEARLSDMKFDIDIPDVNMIDGGLPDDVVKLDFRISEGVVQYIRTMTPLDRAAGYGQLRANSLDLTLTSGRVGLMNIEKGRVDIPQFFPFGNNFTIDFEGSGPVDYMIELIDQKPFEYASLYNLVPKEFSGQARAAIKITRPLGEVFDPSLINYEIEVNGDNISAPFGFGEYKLTNGSLFLTADKTGMTIKGPAQLGPLYADFNWRETFDYGATPTELTFTSQLNTEALDKFGLGLREYFGGELPFTLYASGQGVAFDKAIIKANLQDSEWVFGNLWSKPIGRAGDLELSVLRRADGQLIIDNFLANAPGLSVEGALRLDKDMRLLEASIAQLSVNDLVDARLTMTRETIDRPLQATLTGDYLNLEGFIGPTLWQSDNAGTQFPLTLSASLNTLSLAPDYKINKANFIYNNSGTTIDQFRFSGGSEAGLVMFDLQSLDEGPFSSQLQFDLANASDVVSAFFNLDNITGGRLYGEAVRPRAGDDLIWSGTVNVDDFTLIDAPFLAQMLSLASLNGLNDVLNGDGINFETVEVPFTWGQGVLGLESARAAGPALGLTADGQINIASKNIDIDGTLIPAYAANSILGSIPLLGDIFGGRADDATLGLTYAVKGSFGEAQVSVNPLSALTPGILRQIFKPKREKRRIEIPSDLP